MQNTSVDIEIRTEGSFLLAGLSKAKTRRHMSPRRAADGRQTDSGTYLYGILLGGLLLNTLFGLWWADPAAGVVMVPIIAKEGIAGWQGKACRDSCHEC